MQRLLFSSVLAIASLVSPDAGAAPLAAPVRAEIDALFKKLQASGCQFNRNDTWYSGVDAQSHLTRKRDYLEKKDLLKSTEDFIDLGASASSSSGKPYLVRCGNTPAVPSKTWLHAQLKLLRQVP